MTRRAHLLRTARGHLGSAGLWTAAGAALACAGADLVGVAVALYGALLLLPAVDAAWRAWGAA